MRTLILASVLIVSACSSAARPAQPTPRVGFDYVADSLIHVSDLSKAVWGIEVYDPARDRVLYSHNGNRHFIPASNTKLITTTVAMGTLGPDYRYRTPLLATSRDSVIAALVLEGRGDPTWSERFNSGDFTVLQQLADSVARAGVRRIDNLVIDASRFGRERVHYTWEISDLPGIYAPPVAAVGIAEGTLQLRVQGGPRAGDSAVVSIIGPRGVFPVVGRVTTDTAGVRLNLDVDYQSWPDTIRVSGSIGANATETTRIAAPDAARFATAVFADALRTRGITVGATTLTYDSADVARAGARVPIATWTSQPMSEIVAAILRPSQNWIAEQVMRTVGAEKGANGSWGASAAIERRYLVDVVGLDSTDFQLRDGSGMSAQTLMTPKGFVRILEHTRKQPWASLYREALPAALMPGSTLSSRFRGLENRIFAKTGSITNVSTLSGFIVTDNGRELTFSILVNASGSSQAQVRRGMDRLVFSLAAMRDLDDRR